jgi:hypothetical protein
MAGLNLISFNCRGYNSSKKNYISSLLNTCDILFLQEHWLSDAQTCMLSEVNSDFLYIAVSGFNPQLILAGRPYGGCAIFWRKSLNAKFRRVDIDSRRIVSVSVDFDSFHLLLVNVYMPYECSSSTEKLDDFIDQLMSLNDLLDHHCDAHVILGGDCNVDLSRNTVHTQLLDDFVKKRGLVYCNSLPGYDVDYSYQFDLKRFSILDHFMLSPALASGSNVNITVIHELDNTSDHDPIRLHLDFDMQHLSVPSVHRASHPAWYKCTEKHLSDYRCSLKSILSSLDIPVGAVICDHSNCTDSSHNASLNQYASSIIDCCFRAAESSIPFTGHNVGHKGAIPGWNEHVQPLRDKALLWHKIWVDSGRPHDGWVAQIRRFTRAKYHRAIRHTVRINNDITKERIAECLLYSDCRDYWSEIKRIRRHNRNTPAVVDDCKTPTDIANLFGETYQKLLSSVPSPDGSLDHIRKIVDAELLSCHKSNKFNVSWVDIASAVHKLKHGKRDGDRGLTSDYFIHGCNELYVHLAVLITAMFSHGTVIDDLRISTIIPIPKDKNVCDSTCYRGITLSSVIGKVIDLVCLDRFADQLMTSELQFGFKKGHSTNACTMVLKETIAYYTSNHNSVFLCFPGCLKSI